MKKIVDIVDRLDFLVMHLGNTAKIFQGEAEKKMGLDPAPEPMFIQNIKFDPAPEPKCECKCFDDDEYYGVNVKAVEEHLSKMFKPVPDPAPPLKAQVANCLGKKLMLWEDGWRMLELVNPPEYKDQRRWVPIPPYDTDRDLAMGALEEYCKKNDLILKIEWSDTHSDFNMRYSVAIYNPSTVARDMTDITLSSANSLPKAICQAIVKHKEQAK